MAQCELRRIKGPSLPTMWRALLQLHIRRHAHLVQSLAIVTKFTAPKFASGSVTGSFAQYKRISAKSLPSSNSNHVCRCRTSHRQRQHETDSFLIGSDFLTCLLAPDGDAGVLHRQGNAASPFYPFLQRRLAGSVGFLVTYFPTGPNGDLPKGVGSPPSSPAAIGASSSLGQRRRLKL